MGKPYLNGLAMKLIWFHLRFCQELQLVFARTLHQVAIIKLQLSIKLLIFLPLRASFAGYDPHYQELRVRSYY